MGTIMTAKNGRQYYVPTKEERREMNARDFRMFGIMFLGGTTGFFMAVGMIEVFQIGEPNWPLFIPFTTVLSFLGGGALNMRLRDGHW